MRPVRRSTDRDVADARRHAGGAVAAGAVTGLAPVPLQAVGGDLLWLAIVFFVLALVAAVVGFRGVAGLSMSVARLLVIVFLVLAVISLLL